MQSMKGATSLLGSMNRQMNLPALQRIAMEFEKENDVMDQRQEMMDDAIDDVTGVEDEEEGEEVVKEVLDEIGVDLGQAVRYPSLHFVSVFVVRGFDVEMIPECFLFLPLNHLSWSDYWMLIDGRDTFWASENGCVRRASC